MRLYLLQGLGSPHAGGMERSALPSWQQKQVPPRKEHTSRMEPHPMVADTARGKYT
jgi:hypothetical protein